MKVLFSCLMFPLISFSQIDFSWAKSVGSTNLDQVNTIAVDINGNSYSAGGFQGTIDFDPGSSVYNMTANGTSDIYVLKLDDNGDFLWAIQMGGGLADAAVDIECDSQGNIYITGSFNGPADFDPGSGIYSLNSTNGDDPFVAKYSTNGDLIFANSIFATGAVSGIDVAIDSELNVYSTGFYWGNADLDPSGSSSYNVTSNGNRDIYIQKLDSSGNFLWGSSIGGAGLDYVESMKLDDSNNLIIGGYFNGTSDFDGSSSNSYLTSYGNEDAFICKYDNNGNYIWSKQFGGVNGDVCRSLSLDSDNNTYFIGTYSGTSDFDPGASVFNLTSSISTSYMVKIDSNGDFVWANSLNIDYAEYVSVNNYSIYTTGNFTGTADFDPGTGTYNLTSQGGSDIFISKLDSSGSFDWAKSLPSNTGSVGDVVRVGPNNTIYIVGEYADTCDFDIGSGIHNIVSNGNKDVFIAKYSEILLELNDLKQSLNDIVIFPNPTSDRLTIETSEQIGVLSIIDVRGELVWEIENFKKHINVSELSNGIYFLKFKITDEVLIKKFVKQ